jgi:hypothetical protein
MKRMKLLLFFLAGLACAAEIEGVHRVYLMPMSHGMDQYLANRLAGEHIFVVVTDPKLADAVFTDRLGEGFRNQWEELAAAKNPEPVAKPAEATPGSFVGETANKLSNPASYSSFGRTSGTLFLVDPKSHAVVWATYDPPKDSSAKELAHTASDIVERLKKVLNPKK